MQTMLIVVNVNTGIGSELQRFALALARQRKSDMLIGTQKRTDIAHSLCQGKLMSKITL
jgi:hypothetical protein